MQSWVRARHNKVLPTPHLTSKYYDVLHSIPNQNDFDVIVRKMNEDSRVDASLAYETIAKKRNCGLCWKHEPTQAKKSALEDKARIETKIAKLLG